MSIPPVNSFEETLPGTKHSGSHTVLAVTYQSLWFVSRGEGAVTSLCIDMYYKSKQTQANLMMFFPPFLLFGDQLEWMTPTHSAPKGQKGYSLQRLSVMRSHKAGSSQLKAKEMLSVVRRCFFSMKSSQAPG